MPYVDPQSLRSLGRQRGARAVRRRRPMIKSASPGPAAWRVLAGPESVMSYTLDHRAEVAMWTADRSGRMRRGDVVLLYGTTRLQAYVAVARVCSTPRQNDRAQHFRKNREWWTYLEVQPLRIPIPRAQIESRTFAQPESSGVKTPAGSRCNQVSAAALAGFAKVLRGHDPSAAARFDRWIAGRGNYPQQLDLEELRWSDWNPPTAISPEELRLSKRIAAHLVATRDFRYVTPEELGTPSRPGNKFGCSLEHSIRDLAGTGRVDILLVDRRSAEPTLLAIEVKIRASLAPSRNPVPQIIRYRAALASRYPAWKIRSLVVAEHFAEAVVKQANDKGIAHRTCTHQSGKLLRPL